MGGETKDALANANKAVDLAPENADAHIALAAVQLSAHAYEDGLKSAQKAVELDAQSAAAQAILARAYLCNTAYDKAKEAVEKAYALDAHSALVYYALMQYYHGVKDFARAKAASQKLIELEPKFVPWRIVLAELYIDEENAVKAVQVLSDTLMIAPDYLYAYSERSYAYTMLNDFAAAQADADKLLKLYPNRAETYSAQGVVLENQQKYDEGAGTVS